MALYKSRHCHDAKWLDWLSRPTTVSFSVDSASGGLPTTTTKKLEIFVNFNNFGYFFSKQRHRHRHSA